MIRIQTLKKEPITRAFRKTAKVLVWKASLSCPCFTDVDVRQTESLRKALKALKSLRRTKT